MGQLEDQGIMVKRSFKTTSTSVNGMELSSKETTELSILLPRPSALKAKFSKEGILDKVGKLFKKELQTGDAAFDKAIYISTDTTDETRAFLANPDVRAAVQLSVETGGPITIDGEAVTIEIAGRHDEGDDPQVVTIVRALLG
jgi:hypothetical protein